MTISELAKRLSLSPITEPQPSREVTGGYAGDLLSWVMGRAAPGSAWVTIMTNANIVAVATLSDAAAIILAEGQSPEREVVETALQRGVNIYTSELDSFRLCAGIAALL